MAKKTGLSLKNIYYTCCEKLMVHLQQREVNIDEAKLTLQGLTEAALRLPLEVLEFNQVASIFMP